MYVNIAVYNKNEDQFWLQQKHCTQQQ